MTNITIEDLEAYRGLASELEALQKERNFAYTPYNSPGSHPYIGEAKGNSVSNPTEQAVHKLEKIDQRIAVRQNEIAERLNNILNWLDSLEDAELRAMIHWHYLLGLDWGKTCKKLYGYHSYQTCRKRVLRYFGVEK